MLSKEQLLKIDPGLADLSEAELEEVRVTLYDLGQLAFDVWWLEKSGSKNPLGLLTSDIEKASMDI